AAGIAIPTSGLLATLHHAGAHNDIIAALELDLLLLCRLVKIVIGDAITIIERVDALVARDIKKNTTADHFVLRFFDSALLRTGARHFAAVIAVPHIVLIKNVAETVPLRAALQWHRHHIVRRADAALIEHTGI